MSTFYLLPPRTFLGERIAGQLATLLPGIEHHAAGWSSLVEGVLAAIPARPDVYFVFREDLPDGEDPARALADGFGAEAGDEVIEVRPGVRSGEWSARRWQLPERRLEA